MSDKAMNKIIAIEARTGHRLAVTWADGQQHVISLAEDVRRPGVFSHLIDENAFNQVRIGARNRSIEWFVALNEYDETIVDIDADGLLDLAYRQRSESFFRRLLHLFSDRRELISGNDAKK